MTAVGEEGVLYGETGLEGDVEVELVVVVEYTMAFTEATIVVEAVGEGSISV